MTQKSLQKRFFPEISFFRNSTQHSTGHHSFIQTVSVKPLTNKLEKDNRFVVCWKIRDQDSEDSTEPEIDALQ